MIPSATTRLYCVHMAQLTTHAAVHTIFFNLQSCWKPLFILQRVTKSPKARIMDHGELKKLSNFSFA